MMPGLLFVSLFSLSLGVLQCEKQFFVSGVLPVVLNVVWIAAIIFLRKWEPEVGMQMLAVTVVIGVFLQWFLSVCILFPRLLQFFTLKEWFTLPSFSASMRKIFFSFGLGALGSAFLPISSFVDYVMVCFVSYEGPVYLNCANRLYQLPFSFFAISMNSVILPLLSRSLLVKEKEEFFAILRYSLHNIWKATFFASMAIVMLGGATINLLFGRGLFHASSVFYTTQCLMGYAIGLAPASMVVVLSSAFYAKQDFYTPLFGTLISTLSNVIVGSILVFGLRFGVASIAVATTVSSFVNMQFLFFKMRRDLCLLDVIKGSEKFCCSVFLTTLFFLVIEHFFYGRMILLLWPQEIEMIFPRTFSLQLGQFCRLCCEYFSLFFIACYFVGDRCFLDFLRQWIQFQGLKKKKDSV